MTSHGVTPSLGHTDCDDATAAASLAAAREGLESAGFDGVSSLPTVTHLFNGMPPLHHRAPGPVAACLRMAQEGRRLLNSLLTERIWTPALWPPSSSWWERATSCW